MDGNLKNFGSDEKWPAGSSMEGAKGTTPAGPLEADSGFQDRLNEWWVGEGNTDLTDFSYANESYDAVILLALAALTANSTESADIAANLQQVSGEGDKCDTFEACADIILGGGMADYDGYSGPITFDENGDPTEATIGIFQFGADNLNTRIG